MRVYLLVLWIGCHLCSSLALGQESRIDNLIVPGPLAGSLGDDYWLAFPQASDSSIEGKHCYIQVTASLNDSIFVRVGNGKTSGFPVQAGKAARHELPVSTSLRSSGVVERSGVRVWSRSGPFLLHAFQAKPELGDGFAVLPTSALGKEYIIASYNSYLDPGFGWDHPSEFALVASEDNTIVTITPMQDIRESHKTGVVQHPRGIPFTERLSRGETVQYQVTYTQDTARSDLTGTTVVSDKAIGVISGTACANVPAMFYWCDQLFEMLLPTRHWRSSYVSAPFAERIGGDSFLLLPTITDQSIQRRFGSSTSTYKFDGRKPMRFSAIKEASLWQSDAPFSIVQYINSQSFPDPYKLQYVSTAMTGLVAPTNFDTSVPIHSLSPPVGGGTFQNFVAIFHPHGTADSLRIDGKLLRNDSTAAITPEWEYTLVRKLDPGFHTLSSSIPVGAIAYGQGGPASYAWPANLPKRSRDRTPPAVAFRDSCMVTYITITDSSEFDGGIMRLRIDDLTNFTVDSVFHPRTTSLVLRVIDHSKVAVGSFHVSDSNGNSVKVYSSYAGAPIASKTIDLGKLEKQIRQTRYDTICNRSNLAFDLQDASFAVLRSGFRLDSTAIPTQLDPGECTTIRTSFAPVAGGTHRDTLVLRGECGLEARLTFSTFFNGQLSVTQNEDQHVPSLPACLSRGSTSVVDLNLSQAIGMIMLIDLLGNAVGKWRVEQGVAHINLSQLAVGSYFLRVEIGEEVYSKKVTLIQ